MKHFLSILLALCCFLSFSFACGEKEDNKYGSGQTTGEQPGENPGSLSDDSSKIVLAYVTSGTAIMPDPAYLTHINYAFGHVNETYNGVNIENPDRLKSMVTLKKQKSSLKVLLSIGGWTSGRFSEMAMTEGNRKSFAADCKRIVDDFGLDGIDMDWEYPTSNAAGISSSSKDRENYNLLMQEIRNAIGYKKLLTFASAASSTVQYYDLATLSGIVDFVNIMMYDISRPPYHHSALHQSEHVNGISADQSIAEHIAGGMPAKKLVLGVPFYGHGDSKAISDFIDYKNIIQLKGFAEKWDDVAKMPYLVDANDKIVCVYDNAQSLTLKCEYLLQQHLRGAMYWQYAGDDADGTLRKAVWNGVMKE
jgi:chitinase